jgi:hypothetical protein
VKAVLVGLLAIVAVPLRALADPHIDYILHCQGCHGPDGGGAPGGVPSFRAQLAKFLWIPGGREYVLRVPGTAQSELSDARVAALLNWMVRTFSTELSDGFLPFSEAEVARTRRPPLTDVSSVRANLMRAIAAVEQSGNERGTLPVGGRSFR